LILRGYSTAIPWIHSGLILGAKISGYQCWRGFQAVGPVRIGAKLGKAGQFGQNIGQKGQKGAKAQ